MIHGAVLFAAIAVLAGGETAHRYGDRLLADAAIAHKSIAGLQIEASDTAGKAIFIAEGSVASGIRVPLHDAMGVVIGRLTVAPRPGCAVDAAAIASELARHIYSASSLVEPDPFVPGATTAPRAQVLVEHMLARFPDLLTLSLHVDPPGEPNRIVASSFGRIGKPGDADDVQVIRDGAVLQEQTNGGRRYAIELPLLDQSHRTLGALSASFVFANGQDPRSLVDRAAMVRDDLAHAIPSVRWLLKSR